MNGKIYLKENHRRGHRIKRRCRRAVAAAGPAVFALGLTGLATAPDGHADTEDLLVAPVVDVLEQAVGLVASAPAAAQLDALLTDLGQAWAASPLGQSIDNGLVTLLAGTGGNWLFPGSAAAAGTGTGGTEDTLTNAFVPLQMNNTTQPQVNISVDGGPSIPVLVDTGSVGLLIPWWDLGFNGLTLPIGFGEESYGGGDNYGFHVFYAVMPSSTVDFGNDIFTGTDIVTKPTSIDVELFAWPTSLNSHLGGTAEGILGIGPNANGPGPSSPTTALPGDLGQGVFIDQALVTNSTGSEGVLGFGPDPLRGGVPVVGVPYPESKLEVSINNGPLQPVTGEFDSGGVYGTLPASILGYTPDSGVVPAGTLISVYTQDGDLLYWYLTNAQNGPTVTTSNTMITGYVPFQLQPVYISYNPSGIGTVTFGYNH